VVAVVDDEPEMRKAFRRLLSSRQFAVEEYESGDAFFAALSAHPPDCVLLDLQMPGTNGFGVLKACQDRNLRLPIVVITAHDEPGVADQVKSLGALACLKKPVEQNTLICVLQAAVAAARHR